MELDNRGLTLQAARFDEFELEKLYRKMTGETSGILYMIMLMIGTFFMSTLVFLILFGVLWFVVDMLISGESTHTLVLFSVSAFLSLCFAVFYIFHTLKEKAQLKKILQYGIETTGEIVSIIYVQRSPTLIKYSYKDEKGITYLSKQRLWKYDCPNALRIGETFPVYYLRENSSKSIFDYSHFVTSYDVIEKNREYARVHGGELSQRPSTFDSALFTKKYYSKMKMYDPIWWAYLLILLLISMQPLTLLLNGLIEFPEFLRMLLSKSPLIIVPFFIDIIVNQSINFMQFSKLRNLYAKGNITTGKLLGCDTSFMNNIRFSKHRKFPMVAVRYLFKLPSGDDYTASVNLPVPRKMPEVKIGDSYPVYYDIADPRKSTIDIFGFSS